jgi:4-amino-4-deoxy-L-arabinose transferase-like glycosyltransferase
MGANGVVTDEIMATNTIDGGTMPPLEAGAGPSLSVPWHRVALGLILALAAFLNFYQLDRVGYGNTYYAAAVKSMMQNWHNFFFNSFDPGGFVTIDKPPLGFWFQVLSAKLFGYNGVSLILPEALAGVLSVALLYHLVRRVFGPGAALVAALMLALTPVTVAADRNNIIDSILVLFLLLGAWAVSRAVESRQAPLRWLLLCAVFVGLGFNVKMMEAYLVVPAFGLMYLVGAHVRWRSRVAHLALAVVVLLAVSLSWATAVDLTPASQRPWVDSTSTNSELDLATGYNGLDRLFGRNGGPGGAPRGFGGAGPAGAVPQQPGAGGGASLTVTGGIRVLPGAGTAIPGTATANQRPTFGGGLFGSGPTGPFRLLNADLGGQVGWLIPLALISLLLLGSARLRYPLDEQQKALVMWGMWLLTTIVFFSVANFFHSYYLVTLAPAAAALAGIGLVALWRDYASRMSPKEWRGWMLPAALIVAAVAQVYVLGNFPDWSRWLTPLIAGATLLSAAILLIARLRLRRGWRIWTPLAAALGATALLFAPLAWTLDTIANNNGGMTPSAGPTAQRGFGGFGRGTGGRGGFDGRAGSGRFGGAELQNLMRRFGDRNFGGFPGGNAGRGGGGGVNTAMLHYLEQQQGTTRFLFATANSMSAAPYIIQTGKPVMSLGGFSGSDPILTVAQFQQLVKNNTVRFVFGGGGRNGVEQWVTSTCAAVPSSAWTGAPAGSTSSTQPGAGIGNGGGFGAFGGQALYDCAGK